MLFQEKQPDATPDQGRPVPTPARTSELEDAPAPVEPVQVVESPAQEVSTDVQPEKSLTAKSDDVKPTAPTEVAVAKKKDEKEDDPDEMDMSKEISRKAWVFYP